MIASPERTIQNVKISAVQIFLCGVGIGSLSFIVAELTIPKNASHDLALAQGIGFVFPALSGWWIGWQQRSLSRTITGIAVGSGIGYAYACLCGSRFNPLGIQICFPFLCGGLFAMLVGSNKDAWLDGMGMRFLKGLVAGLACGVTFTVLNDLILAMNLNLLSFSPHDYINKMWQAGVPALGFAGGIFFCIFYWAIRLNEH